MVRTTESKYVHQKTRLFGKSITASLQTKPDFGHPRAKLISPTHKMCSSVLASKSASRIQRNVCLAIPARTRQEGKKQNAKASQKKKVCDSGSTLSVYFDIHVPPVMDESWIHDWTHD